VAGLDARLMRPTARMIDLGNCEMGLSEIRLGLAFLFA